VLPSYADVHVPYPIVQGLRMRGMHVVTAQDRGHHQAHDGVLLSQALQEHRVMLTCDHDFLRLAASLSRQGEPFAPIYFWPQQARSIGEMIRRILAEASEGDYRNACSQVFFL
jgi:predicted nuclease of predicted toxin-antitoxin system